MPAVFATIDSDGPFTNIYSHPGQCRADIDSWMEGLVLMLLYLIIAVSFWYYPVSDPSSPFNLSSPMPLRALGPLGIILHLPLVLSSST
jgi:hypothetical protein